MKDQYSANNLDGHISNIELKPYDNDYKKGFIISSGNDEIAVYNEFGTGIVGYENPNPLAEDANYQYNISIYKGTAPEGAIKEYGQAYCDEWTTPDTWWYHKNNKWWHTRGMKGKNMYSSLVDELRETGVKNFKTSISQKIENYKSFYGGK